MTPPVPLSQDRPEEALQSWKDRHALEARWLRFLDIDWPGSREVSLRFVRHVIASVEDPDRARSLIDEHLAASVRAYRTRLEEGDLPDRERLQAFFDGLTAKLPAEALAGRTPEGLVAGWLPRSLARALSSEAAEPDNPDAA
jgi:hypothetical protein